MRNKEITLKEVIKDTLCIILFGVMLISVVFCTMYIWGTKVIPLERTDYTISATKISIKNIKWNGKTRVIDCDFEPIDGAKKYYVEVCPDEFFIFGCIKSEINASSPLRVHIEQNKRNASAPVYVRVRAELPKDKITDWSKVATIKADKKLAEREYWHTTILSLVLAGTILFTIKTIYKCGR